MNVYELSRMYLDHCRDHHAERVGIFSDRNLAESAYLETQENGGDGFPLLEEHPDEKAEPYYIIEEVTVDFVPSCWTNKMEAEDVP